MTHRPLRVLVVEDEPVLRELMAAFLELEGHHVVGLENGKAALEWAAGDAPAMDAAIVDIHMAYLDGLDTIRGLRRHLATREVPILVVSAFGSGKTPQAAREAGADAVLGKPFTRESILCGLSEVLKTKGKLAEGETLRKPG